MPFECVRNGIVPGWLAHDDSDLSAIVDVAFSPCRHFPEVGSEYGGGPEDIKRLESGFDQCYCKVHVFPLLAP